MKLRKRLSAVILAAVMTVSSIQTPARVSYAAKLPEDGIEFEQEVFNGAIPDDVSHAGNDKPTDAGNMEEVEIDGAYQFGNVPRQAADNGISLFAATYDEKELDEYLYQQMLERNPYIDIEEYQIAYSKADSLVSGVLNEHPDLYFVNKKFSIGVNETGSRITELIMRYSNDYDNDAFNVSVKEALSCVNGEMSDLEKVIALHDYLAVNIEYDYKNYQAGTLPDVSYTAYGALVNRTSVCEGYALAYKYLLNKLGIECYMVKSDSMRHAWNMVKLDDEYYHVDVTSDDPVWDRIGQVTHTYMLFSDEAHMEKYSDWKVTFASTELNYKAADDSYDLAFWKDSNAPLVFSEDGCYYVSGSGSIRKGNCADIANQGPEIAKIGSWPTWDQSGTWPGVYSGLYMIDGRLYYNDNSAIYSVRTDGTDKQTAFTADTSNGYIYGSAYSQGKVYYALHKSPNLTAKEDVLMAEITGVSGEEVDPSIPEVGMKEGWNITPPTPKDDAFFTDGVSRYRDSLYDPLPPQKGASLVMFVDGSFEYGDDEISSQLLYDIREHTNYINYVDIICIDVSNGFYQSAIGKLFDCSYTTFLVGSKGEKDEYDERYYVVPDVAIEYAKEYCEAVKEKNPAMAAASKPYPSLFYIKDGKIQYAEINQTSTYSILCNLQEYCGYTRYALTYHLNTGDEKDIISDVYDASEDDISLLTPDYRDGYRFDGWYSDEAYTKRVTKIPAGTKSNIELYAKWSVRKGGFDLDNPEQEYTALDDTIITSTADGKPKLLMFYRDSSETHRNYVDAISNVLKDNPEHDLDGVDIYAIDFYGSGKSSIENNHQDTSENIIFSYALRDDGNINYNNMMYYIESVGYKYSYNTFYICYIDAQNRFQYMSSETDVDQIMFNLRTYCNYPTAGPEFYMIRYELNGGTNNSENPNRYHNEMTDNIMLEAPTKAGYTFVGWYEDAAFTERVTEISPDRGEDITLYAKWKENKGVNADNPEYRFVTVDGNGAGSSKALNGRPKVMVFANENCGNSKTLAKNIKEKIDLFQGADIVFAVVTKTNTTAANQYMSTLKAEYGCDGVVFCTDDGSNSTREGDYVSKGQYQTVGGLVFSPVIAYIDGNDKLQLVETRYNAESVFNDLREYCDYDAYRINYVLGGGTNDSENPEVYLGDSQTITLKDPTRKGCVFEGWYKDIGYTKRVTEINPESKADYTLYAKWSVKKGGYDLENLTQEYTAMDGTTVNSTASGKPKMLIFGAYDSYTGNVLKDVKSELDQSDSLLHGVDIYVVTEASNIATMLKMFYGDTDEIIYTYDSNCSQNKEAYKEAAECGGSDLYGPTIVYVDENNALQYVYPGVTGSSAPTAADIIKALKKYCNYPSNDTYTITYVLNGGTNNSENPVTYTSETETITLADASREGYTFAGWYQDAEFTESGKVTEIVKGSKGNITLYAKWEEASLEEETYIITYELDGGSNDGNDNPGTYTAKTETIILKAAVKEGYVFEGWYKDADFKAEVKEIVKGSTGNITLYAKWGKAPLEEETYKITYELDGGTNDSGNPGTYTAKTETIPLKAAVKEGYVFAGWYKDAGFKEKVTEIVKGSTGNITLYARWSQADVTVSVIKPDKTTYKIGQELVVAGGKVVLTDKTGKHTERNMELGMLMGFDSSKAGICKVMVTCDGYTGSFDTLIVEEPKLMASFGQRLGAVTLPMNEYGTYTWAEGVNADQKLTKAGVHVFGAVFTPKDTDKFQTLTDIQISVTVQDTSGEDGDDRIDLSTADVTIANIKAKVYDALEYEPVLKVKLNVTVNGKKKTLTLVEGADYSVEYENNVEVGTGTAYVTGNGMYKGEISKQFTINPKSVKKLKVITGNVAGSTSSGGVGSNSADLPVYVYDGRKLLTKGEDINVAVKTSTAKAITVEITAANGSNYTGSRTAKLTVFEKAGEENVINPENIVIGGKSFVKEYETAYTGKAVRPEVAVIIGDTTLTSKDYKVSYQNNKDAGTAYVIVTAKGAYKGKVVVPFRIVPVSPELTITNTIKAKTYNGKLQKPSVTVKAGKVTLKKNRDYKVTYTENLHAGTATVTITARGNYTGSAKKTFVINKQNIKKVSVKGTLKDGVSVYYGTRLLQENRDYTLSYGLPKGKNKVEVIITATEGSDFSGSITKSVKIQ